MLISPSLKNAVKVRMRLREELIGREHIHKLSKRSRTLMCARHPPQSTSTIIVEVDNGIELHDMILIVLVLKGDKWDDPKSAKSIITPGKI